MTISGADLNHVRSFLEVARVGSFSGAAARRHLTQQAVSAHVQRLERALGTELLTRTTRFVALTPAGSAFALAATEAIDQLDRVWAQAHVADGQSVELVQVGMSVAAAHEVAPDLRDLVARRRLGVGVVLHEMAPMDVISRLRTGTLDLGFVLEPPEAHNLDGIVLGEGTIAPMLSRHLPVARKRRCTVADLEDLTLVIPTVDANPHLHQCALAFADRHGLTRTTLAIGATTLPRSVYAGTAYALWPTVTPTRYAPTDLAVVPFREPQGRVDLWLLFRADHRRTAVAAVIDVARAGAPGVEHA